MAKIAYENWRPGYAAMVMLQRADAISREYAAQGYDLTLRQLYYQFVARGYLPNIPASYGKLGGVVNRGRLSGYIDWNHITDRTRNLKKLSHWDDPADIIDTIANQFRVDTWSDQPIRVEVWVEKEALAGVVGQAASRDDCSWFSCRGYVSQSEMWSASQRLRRYIEAGQRCVVLHLGDHDPSGIDMTRDITDRLEQFIYGDVANDFSLYEGGSASYSSIRDAIEDEYFAHVDADVNGLPPLTVNRIALNMDQIEELQPPPNPAKSTDTRYRDYQERYGDESWELDALDPATLDALISQSINEYVDDERMEGRRSLITDGRNQLRQVSDRWDEVAALVAS